MKNFRHSLIFIIMLVLVAVFYEYSDRYSEFPMTTNHSLSIALNYYQNGMDFLHPQVHNLLGGKGYFVAEFPILSYFVALLYKWFGVHEGLLGLVNFFILSLGLLSLSKMILRLTGDEMYSFFVPLILMATPVLGFYAFGFSTDVAALGLLFMGFNTFSKYYDDSQLRHWLWASCYFLLSGLLNSSFALMVIPLLVVFILESVGLLFFKANGRLIFRHKIIVGVSFLILVGGVLSWFLFTVSYNDNHAAFLAHEEYIGVQGVYMLLNTKSISEALFQQLSLVTVLIAFLIWTFFIIRKQRSWVYVTTVASFFGMIVHYLFRPITEEGHHILLGYFFLAMILVNAGLFLQKKNIEVFSRWSLKWLIAILMMVLIYFNRDASSKNSRNSLSCATSYFESYQYTTNDLNPLDVRQFLDENGVKYNTKVVSIPDRKWASNTLYFTNLQGWTIPNYTKNLSQELTDYASSGAKYLIVFNESALYSQQQRDQLIFPESVKNPIANYKQKIFLFDIQHLVK